MKVFDIEVRIDHNGDTGASTAGERKDTTPAGAGGLLASSLAHAAPGDDVTVKVTVRDDGR